MFLRSPNKAKVSDKFEVQPYVFGLAPTGLECRVLGSSGSSFCHHQTFTLSIQVALEGEWMIKYEAKFLLQHQLAIPVPFNYRYFTCYAINDVLNLKHTTHLSFAYILNETTVLSLF